MVQWLRLHTGNAGSMGSIPGQGTKILHAVQCCQKIFFLKKDFPCGSAGRESTSNVGDLGSTPGL